MTTEKQPIVDTVSVLREGISKYWKVVCDQRAEIERLRETIKYFEIAHKDSQQHVNKVEARLVEAHALLRKISGYNWSNVDPEERARTRAQLRDHLCGEANPTLGQHESECAECLGTGREHEQ